MVGWLEAFLLLGVAMSAQEIQGPKIKIFFPEGHNERASMTYAMHVPSGGYNYHFGMSMPSGDLFFEIPAATDRFKALVWAPGCEMKGFDVPIEKADTELKFVCDPLKTVAFFGRVKSVNIGGGDNFGQLPGIWDMREDGYLKGIEHSLWRTPNRRHRDSSGRH